MDKEGAIIGGEGRGKGGESERNGRSKREGTDFWVE